MKTEFSRPVEIRPFLEAGKELVIEAGADERAALARRFKIPAVESFTVSLSPAREGAGLYTLRGRVAAQLKRTCVRTLEPMEETVDDVFEMAFAEPEIVESFDEERRATPEDIEAIGDEPVDLGELAAQYLSLMMAQYPVSPSAPPEAGEAKGEPGEGGPFAALKNMKIRQKRR